MQSTTFSLGELLRRAADRSLTIPQFQRRFVWRESQVKLLIDSMSRSYPIGSLLLLDKKPELSLSSRSIEAEIRVDDSFGSVSGGLPGDANEKDTEAYILDGQQRTTSIARVFLNAHPKKLYYFDLMRMYENHQNGETSWIVVRNRGKHAPDRKDKNRLLRADIVLNQEKADIYVSEYIEDSEDFRAISDDSKERRVAAVRIKGIFERVRNYKVPVVTLERDSGVEPVCRIFETINSTGTRLTTFDLAVARFYPKPDLRILWDRSLEDHAVLKDFDVDGEHVMQVLYLITTGLESKYPEPTRSNILALDHDAIQNNWKRSAEFLARAYEWALLQGARPKTLPNRSVLVAMAAIRSTMPEEGAGAVTWEDSDFIRRWYFSKVMQSGASQASNYRIGLDFTALRRYVEDNIRPNVLEIKIDRQSVVKIRPADVRYKALQNLFATTMRHDLVTGDNIDANSDLHDHHIYPRNAAKKKGLPVDMLDSICNRVPILGESNRKLGEAYPDEYLGKLAASARQNGTLEGLKRRLRDCMIPGDPAEPGWPERFSLSNFESFCRDRADMIIRRVKGVVGDSLRVSPSTDDDMMEYIE